jgi:hypothetical protein
MVQFIWDFCWEQFYEVDDFVVLMRLVGLAHIALLVIKLIGLRLVSELRLVSSTTMITATCTATGCFYSSTKGWAKIGLWWNNGRWHIITWWNDLLAMLLLPHLRRSIHILMSWIVLLLSFIARFILVLRWRGPSHMIMFIVWFTWRLRWCHILILNVYEIVKWNYKLHTSSFIWFERRGVRLMVLVVGR